jgi:hypothetical protein
VLRSSNCSRYATIPTPGTTAATLRELSTGARELTLPIGQMRGSGLLLRKLTNVLFRETQIPDLIGCVASRHALPLRCSTGAATGG